MRRPQLTLVADKIDLPTQPQDQTRRVFEHWLYLFERSPHRCKLGPARRRVIDAALVLYGIDTVLLAVEGMASLELDGLPESMRQAMRDIEWFLANERRIERAADHGERVRRELEASLTARPAVPEAAPTAEQVQASEAARERLLAWVKARRGSAGAAHG